MYLDMVTRLVGLALITGNRAVKFDQWSGLNMHIKTRAVKFDQWPGPITLARTVKFEGLCELHDSQRAGQCSRCIQVQVYRGCQL